MFGPFERAVAGRYLRARRGERFVSVIAVFSPGRHRARRRHADHRHVGDGRVPGRTCSTASSGFNGHLGVYAAGAPLHELRRARRAHPRACRAWSSATPVVEGQVLLTRTAAAVDRAGWCAASQPDDLQRCARSAATSAPGSLADFHGEDAIAIGVGAGAAVRAARRRASSRWSRRRARRPRSAPCRACAPTRSSRSSRSA